MTDRFSYAGPYPTPESRGIDRGYAADHERAEKELEGTMAGPKHALADPGKGVKNPEGEFQNPAPMSESLPHPHAGPGPNGAGNSSGSGPVDPQGQQGGTHGGQVPTPPIVIQGRVEGTPLADADDRVEQSEQRRGAGIDEQF